ncbi:hypothetical protein GLAREA_10461 [Glarea lozoyensis ATCC 20868]|uniref:Transcription factor domain-containing protein n=1 Tax=Glarea lozoyensis (strain ATCC 20868 / MF5171) TaxID=1116229 RepID=S3DS39_GLAL2|nr:uncharacterized protein GLAREA_10461 [Glarea lozoyensis ATCC 20868]EPE34766.1 hypothetical protein GLAREA_10461 [Glarea lozoyensis ATCC 20868]
MCLGANADCIGFNPGQGTERPRSTVSYWEDQAAQLDIELSRLRSEQTPNRLDQVRLGIEKLTTRLAATIGSPQMSSHTKKEDIASLSLISPNFLCPCPSPLFRENAAATVAEPLQDEQLPKSIKISAIPRHVVDIMLNNYCEIYLKQYPAVEKTEIHRSCDMIYNGAAVSHYHVTIVALALAISVITLMRYDEVRAIAREKDLWATAVEHLQYSDSMNSWQRLQVLQLLVHYSYINPALVNGNNCASAATRLCVQFGLHRELPASEQVKYNSSVLDTRRRLFWHSYSIDAAVHHILCLPYVWPAGVITAKYPDFGIKQSPTAQFWSIRQLEAEITSKMYYPHTISDIQTSNEKFQDWFTTMHSRLDKWANGLQSETANTIEFHAIMYHFAVFRLNRPSPRCPEPTLDMRKRALDSILKLGNEYELQARHGRMFYVFHAAHYLVELGISLLESVMSALEFSEFGPTHVDGIDVTVIKRTVHIISSLLRNIIKRWPAIQNQLTAFDNASGPVLSDLEEWVNGNRLTRSQYTAKRQQFSQFLLPRILQTRPDVDYNAQNPLTPNANDKFLLIPTSLTVDQESSVEHQPANQLIPSIIYTLNQPTEQTFSFNPTDNNPLNMALNSNQFSLFATDQSQEVPNLGVVTGDESLYNGVLGIDSDLIFAALLGGQETML